MLNTSLHYLVKYECRQWNMNGSNLKYVLWLMINHKVLQPSIYVLTGYTYTHTHNRLTGYFIKIYHSICWWKNSKSSVSCFLTHSVFIFQHWKWPAQGTSTVPTVSAHLRSLLSWHAVLCACGSSSYIFYAGGSVAGVNCRRCWPPPTTLALTTIVAQCELSGR